MSRLAIQAMKKTVFSPFIKVPLATRPPEARGISRDRVRLMVSHYLNDQICHHRFRDLTEHLESGDLLVVNTSATLPAALKAQHPDGRELWVHLSTQRSLSEWIIEPRTPTTQASKPFALVQAGDILSLAEGLKLKILGPYPEEMTQSEHLPIRLWRVEPLWPDLKAPNSLAYLARHGKAIRYQYIEQDWPLEAYQTVFAIEPGSAEMPSAGRAFTPELVTALVARGVQIVPLVLHTGVSSQETHEAPYAEYYRIPEVTAAAVNQAIQQGRRIIGVGTTSVRALESAVNPQGWVQAESGWTDLVIDPQRGLKVINGLLTGLHEPQASHLNLLSALTGREHLELTYQAALDQGYLWHEFGDLHLILP